MERLRAAAAECRTSRRGPETFLTLEIPLVRPDGAVAETEAVCRFWPNERTGRLELHGSSRDVSERKRAEAHLRLQAQLLDCVHEAVVSSDMDGTIQYWNREAESLYGYTAAEVLGKPYRSVAGPVEPPDEAAFRKEILAKGSWRGEHLQRRKNGELFWTATFISLVRDAADRPIGYIGIDQDITERTRVENALRESER